MHFLNKINMFGGEHAESAIEVSNSLEAFREFAELALKVSPSMEAESSIGVSNSCDLPCIVLSNSCDLQWFALKSKHFRWKV